MSCVESRIVAYLLFVLLATSCANTDLGQVKSMNDAWNSATTTNSIISYQSFLASYPNSHIAGQAREKLATLKEVRIAFVLVANQNTVEGYLSFLSSHPLGPYADEARRRLLPFLRADIRELVDLIYISRFNSGRGALKLKKLLASDRKSEIDRDGIAMTLPYLILLLNSDVKLDLVYTKWGLPAGDGSPGSSASYILGRFNDPSTLEPLLVVLKEGSIMGRQRAASLLGNLEKPEVVEPLILALKDENYKVQENAIWALRGAGFKDPNTIEPLIAVLYRSHNVNVLTAAIVALGDFETSRVIDLLLSLLNNPDNQIRRTAVSTLARMKNIHTMEGLISAIGHRDKRVATGALRGLGNIESPRAISTLISEMKDEKIKIRRVAIRTTVDFCRNFPEMCSESTLTEIYVLALSDTDNQVRESALKALDQLKYHVNTPRLLENFIKALKDEDWSVRMQAYRILSRRKWVPETLDDKINFLVANSYYVEELIAIGAPALPALMATLKDKSFWPSRDKVITTLDKIDPNWRKL